MTNDIPNTEDFEESLNLIFKYKSICSFVEIQSGKLHKFVGCYPAKNSE